MRMGSISNNVVDEDLRDWKCDEGTVQYSTTVLRAMTGKTRDEGQIMTDEWIRREEIGVAV